MFEQRDRIREFEIGEPHKKIDQGWVSLERGQSVDGEEFFKGLERQEQELGRKRNPVQNVESGLGGDHNP